VRVGSRAIAILVLVVGSAFAATGTGDATIEEGQPVTGALAAADVRRHPLVLAAGQYLRLTARRERADLTVALLDPDGRRLVEADTLVFPPGPLSLSHVAATGGAHTVEVRLAPGGGEGRYEIALDERRAAGPDDERRVEADRAFLAAERRRQEASATALRAAREGFETALALYRAQGDAVGEANAITGIARVRDALGERREALAVYRQALALHRAGGRAKSVSYLLNFIAGVHDWLGERPRAEEVAQEALAAARESGDLRVIAVSLSNIALYRLNQGQVDAALKLYAEALPVQREYGNPRGEATVLASLGSLYAQRGDHARALEYLEQALPIRRAVGDPRDLASTLNTIGFTLAERDEFQPALERYREALDRWRQAGDPSGEAATLHNLASISQVAGEYQEAIRLNEEALVLERATGFRVGEANTLGNLGRLYSNLGDPRRAITLYEDALAIHREAKNPSGEAAVLANLGLARTALGDPRGALELHEKALALRRQVGERRTEAVTLRELGQTHASLGDDRKALQLYGEALALNREVRSRRGEADTLVLMAASHARLHEEAQAQACAGEAASIFRALGDRRGEAAALYRLAVLAAAGGDLEAARADAETAVDRVETLRQAIDSRDLRSSFLARVQDYYGLLIDVLMRLDRQRPDQGLAARALEVSERARARSLLDLLSEVRVGIREGVDPELLDRERSLQRRLNGKAARHERLAGARDRGAEAANLAQEIDVLTGELRTVRAEIRRRSPRYAALTQPEPLGLREIQERVLDGDGLLLEYSLGAERSYLWAVTADSLESHELPSRGVIEAAARRFQDEVRAGAVEPSGAGELGRLLLGPVAGRLPGRRLVVVPEGPLHSVPFAALSSPSAAGYRPLVLDHEIVMLPSASTAALLRTETAGRAPADKTVLVVADPVFDAQDPRVRARLKADVPTAPVAVPARLQREGAGPLRRLLGSRREATAILAHAAGGQGRGALDFEASRAFATGGAFARYRMIHLATHGVLDDLRPELSGVVLSLVDEAGRPQDGFLRLHEIYNLKLAATLVVLSACRTALGQEVRGEGLVGLTRGFMYAGAQRVVASLWQVDDRATAELMSRLYEGMLGRRLTPAAALRAAQVRLLRETRWRSPVYWAAFVLQGDWP
jgi:CHAT domain-containing protein